MKLLVIDMGTCCIVKVEEGQLPRFYVGENPYSAIFSGAVHLFREPFEAVRAAIDALEVDVEQPVPRVEYDEESDRFKMVYRGASKEIYVYVMSSLQYDALNQLAGVTIPIWEPGKRGEWDIIAVIAGGCTVWRYTKDEQKII